MTEVVNETTYFFGALWRLFLSQVNPQLLEQPPPFPVLTTPVPILPLVRAGPGLMRRRRRRCEKQPAR